MGRILLPHFCNPTLGGPKVDLRSWQKCLISAIPSAPNLVAQEAPRRMTRSLRRPDLRLHGCATCLPSLQATYDQ
jgi:hypothetical protein